MCVFLAHPSGRVKAMGRKGWAGAPPADDEEARKRIIDATLRLVDRRGAAQTTVSDIADALGITRRTVYRYFAGTEELFTAVAEVALGSFVAQVDNFVADMDVTGTARRSRRLHHRTTAALAAAGAAAGQRPVQHVQPRNVGARRDRAMPRNPPTRPNRLGSTRIRRRHHRRTHRVPAAKHPVDGDRTARTAPIAVPNFAPTCGGGSGRR